MRSKKVTVIALLCAVAIVLSILENTLLSFTVLLPGVKPGIANIAVLVCLHMYGAKWAWTVALVKMSATFLATGAITVLAYSLAGGILAFAGMAIMHKYAKIFTLAGVSCVGGVLSNVAQTAVMIALTATPAFVYYLPVLIATGALFGLLTGGLSNIIIKNINAKKNSYYRGTVR